MYVQVSRVRLLETSWIVIPIVTDPWLFCVLKDSDGIAGVMCLFPHAHTERDQGRGQKVARAGG